MKNKKSFLILFIYIIALNIIISSLVFKWETLHQVTMDLTIENEIMRNHLVTTSGLAILKEIASKKSYYQGTIDHHPLNDILDSMVIFYIRNIRYIYILGVCMCLYLYTVIIRRSKPRRKRRSKKDIEK